MKYIAGFLLTIFLLIFVFVMIFRNSDQPGPKTEVQRLVDYANTSTEVQLTVDYPISAEQTHRRVVTTVGRDASILSYEQGYEGTVIRSKTYGNNPTSYANFLRALEVSGFNKGVTDEALRDERGYCPQGRRYIMEIKDGNRSIQRFWSTSCGNIGSFKGEIGTVNNLFIRQIPDYNVLTAGI